MRAWTRLSNEVATVRAGLDQPAVWDAVTLKSIIVGRSDEQTEFKERNLLKHYWSMESPRTLYDDKGKAECVSFQIRDLQISLFVYILGVDLIW